MPDELTKFGLSLYVYLILEPKKDMADKEALVKTCRRIHTQVTEMEVLPLTIKEVQYNEPIESTSLES